MEPNARRVQEGALEDAAYAAPRREDEAGSRGARKASTPLRALLFLFAAVLAGALFVALSVGGMLLFLRILPTPLGFTAPFLGVAAASIICGVGSHLQIIGSRLRMRIPRPRFPRRS